MHSILQKWSDTKNNLFYMLMPCLYCLGKVLEKKIVTKLNLLNVNFK